MRAEPEIREARLDDAEEFVRAYEASWDASLESVLGRSLGDLVAFEDRVAAFRDGLPTAGPEDRIWVAERGERILGIATSRVEDGTGELRSLYIVPEEWGSGLAKTLQETALAGMRALGATEAFLWVVESNARARRFYEREGWSPDPARKSGSLGVDEVRYVRAL